MNNNINQEFESLQVGANWRELDPIFSGFSNGNGIFRWWNMKDESRKPLENVSANIVAASALNRFENMAIGGKAGLSVRKQGSSKSGNSRLSLPGEQSALSSTSPSDCSSTFALSTDVSTVSVRPPDNASRNNSPLYRAGTQGAPRYTQFAPEPKLHRPNSPSPGCLKVYPPCSCYRCW